MGNNVLKEELVLNSGQFDNNIEKVIRKVEELKHKGAKIGDGFNGSMSKMIERATGFNGSLSSIVGIVGKFGGAIGAITAGVNLSEWFSNAVAEGTRLAEEAEGVRLAFERLNRGDLLAKLREETHGTVTDMELMKQAVKFNDFNLNLDDMGKFLAFAQMKAKDTGESIDYMVDSIVTGLGRKSLPILDNLGLSAAQIKEYMKDGGDMTTAVAKIIEEKMKEAGDYVETASDRAKKQKAELQNALEELGRTFQPLKEQTSSFFAEIEIGVINAINSLRPLINQFTELGRVINNFNKIGGDEKVNKMINNLGEDPKKSKQIYEAQLKDFERQKQQLRIKIAAIKFSGGKTAIDRGIIQDLEEQIKGIDKFVAEYKRKAQNKLNGNTKKQEPKGEDTGSTGSSSTTLIKSTSHVAKYKAEAQTIQEIEDNITVLNKKLKNTKPDSEEYKNVSNEIKKWKDLLDTTEYKADAQTVQEIEDNITVLNKKLRNTKPNSEEYKNVSAEIKKWKDLLDTTPKPTFIENATVIKDINSNISILQKQLESTVRGSKEWLKITKQIKDETKKLSDIQNGSLADLQSQISEIDDKLSKENLSLKTRLELIDKKAEIQKKIDDISDDSYIKVTPVVGDMKRKRNSVNNAQTNINNIVDDYDSGLIDYNSAKEEIAKINSELQKIGAKPIKVHLETDTEKLIGDIENGANSFMSAFNGIDSVIGNITSLSQAISEGANAWEVFMGVLQTGVGIIQTVSTILNTLNTLQALFGATAATASAEKAAATSTEIGIDTASIGTKTALSVANKELEATTLSLTAAQIFAAHAAIPFAGVGIATGLVAQMLGTMAAVHAEVLALQAYANGGVVGGSQYAGDALLARVNSGEMILNGSQQKNLFNLLDKGATGNVYGGNVNFVIRGKDLHGVLLNYDDKMKKVR